MRYTHKDVEDKYYSTIEAFNFDRENSYIRVWNPGDGNRYEIVFWDSRSNYVQLNARGARGMMEKLFTFCDAFYMARNMGKEY